MELHSMIVENAVKLDNALDELETSLSIMAAVIKQAGSKEFRPTDNYLKRVWLAHEKLGDIYTAIEKAKRS